MNIAELSKPCEGNLHSNLKEEISLHAENCIECNLCRKDCDLLSRHGSPQKIAELHNETEHTCYEIAYQCSLCGLCAAVCPLGLNPSRMFLEMRRQAVSSHKVDLSRYKRILDYEKRGNSNQFSWYGLPRDCNTILFPGCALPGSRPESVKRLFNRLSQTIPNLGIVLDCCSKPSHDLGRNNQFTTQYGEIKHLLLKHGIKRVLVACPSCYEIFRQYGDPLEIETVYDYLAETDLPHDQKIPSEITIHDSCASRMDSRLHRSIRKLLEQRCSVIREMEHTGAHTLCCGEGGTVARVNPVLSEAWTTKRIEEAHGLRMITYCSGCIGYLGAEASVSHILDILFEPEAACNDRIQYARAPKTYFNRLRLKSYFKRKISSTITIRKRSVQEYSFKNTLYAIACLLVVIVVSVNFL